jgi:hypothetical protein
MRTILRLTATGFLVLALAACDAAGSAAETTDTDTDPAVSAANEAPDTSEVDPNEPEDAAAVIYEEEVPVPGTQLDACEIIASDDVKAAFGVDGTVAAGVFEADPTVLSPGHTECRYEGDFGRLIVSLTPEDGANLYDAAYGAYDDLVVIPGVGDGAFWSAGTKRAFIWQDRVTAMIQIGIAGGEVTGLEVATALGEAMIAKL